MHQQKSLCPLGVDVLAAVAVHVAVKTVRAKQPRTMLIHSQERLNGARENMCFLSFFFPSFPCVSLIMSSFTVCCCVCDVVLCARELAEGISHQMVRFVFRLKKLSVTNDLRVNIATSLH